MPLHFVTYILCWYKKCALTLLFVGHVRHPQIDLSPKDSLPTHTTICTFIIVTTIIISFRLILAKGVAFLPGVISCDYPFFSLSLSFSWVIDREKRQQI